MNDLVEFLMAAITEDERVARSVASPPPWVVDDLQRDDRAIYGAARGATVAYDPSGDEESRADFAHIARWDPARVLAECDAKRQIIGEYTSAMENQKEHPEDLAGAGWLLGTIRALKRLALPYAGRPGYREEWKPCP